MRSSGSSSPRPRCVDALVAGLLVGCSPAPRAEAPPSPAQQPAAATATPAPAPRRAPRDQLQIESDIGSLDRAEVKTTFERAMPRVQRCLETRRRVLPFLEGEVEVVVRVGLDGAAVVTYLRGSTLGDREAETCIVEAFRAETWPRPGGGKEGEATQRFELDNDTARAAEPLPPDALGPGRAALERALSSCRKAAGAGPMTVTMYIDPDGKPLAAGLAMDDDRGHAAADCIVRAVGRARLASPGSYPGKISLVIP